MLSSLFPLPWTPYDRQIYYLCITNVCTRELDPITSEPNNNKVSKPISVGIMQVESKHATPIEPTGSEMNRTKVSKPNRMGIRHADSLHATTQYIQLVLGPTKDKSPNQVSGYHARRTTTRNHPITTKSSKQSLGYHARRIVKCNRLQYRPWGETPISGLPFYAYVSFQATHAVTDQQKIDTNPPVPFPHSPLQPLLPHPQPSSWTGERAAPPPTM